MNIKVTQSIGMAFDMLSIAGVKLDKIGGKANIQNFDNLSDEISFQIGRKKFEEIVKSDEYIALYDKNAEIFEMLEYIKNTPIDAKIVDSLNHDRYLLKNKLQEKFFGSKIFETKHGY